MRRLPLDPELCQLVATVVDGEATSGQREELEQRLLASAAARDFYLDYVNLHSALRRRFLAADVNPDQAASELADFRRVAAAETYRARRKQPLRAMAVVAMTAIAIIAATAWFLGILPDVSNSNEEVIATLRAVSGDATIVTAADSRTAIVGDALRPGETLRVGRDASHVIMAYPDGTVIRVHESSTVQSPSQHQVRLRLLAGSMEVDAAKQPPNRPLVFATEHSRYVVLGTRFRLYVEEAESRLELDEGKVRMERPASGETIDVAAGSVAIAADERSPVVIQPLSAGRAELWHTMRYGGQAVKFSADGQTLFSNNWQSGLQAWRVGQDDAPLHEYRRDPHASDAIAFTESGTIALLNRNGVLISWQGDGDRATTLSLPERKARSRALSPDAETAAVSADKSTKVYSIDWKSRQIRERYAVKVPGKAWCLALSRGGGLLAAGFWDGKVCVYNIDTDEIVFETRLQHTPTRLDLSPDGRLLVVFTQKDGLKLIELATSEQHLLWPAGSEMMRCVSFTSDGQRVIAGLHDRTARMWSVADGRQLLVIEAGHAPQGIAWCEELQLLATADGAVKLWKCSFDAPLASTPDRRPRPTP